MLAGGRVGLAGDLVEKRVTRAKVRGQGGVGVGVGGVVAAATGAVAAPPAAVRAARPDLEGGPPGRRAGDPGDGPALGEGQGPGQVAVKEGVQGGQVGGRDWGAGRGGGGRVVVVSVFSISFARLVFFFVCFSGSPSTPQSGTCDHKRTLSRLATVQAFEKGGGDTGWVVWRERREVVGETGPSRRMGFVFWGGAAGCAGRGAGASTASPNPRQELGQIIPGHRRQGALAC